MIDDLTTPAFWPVVVFRYLYYLVIQGIEKAPGSP